MRRRVPVCSVVVALLAFLAWHGGEQASSPRLRAAPPVAAPVAYEAPTSPSKPLPPPTSTTTPAPPVTTTTTTPPPPVTTTTLPPATVPPATVPPPAVSSSGTVNGYPCGGALPTCAVLACESGGNPTAENPSSTASGLWQILDGTWAGFGGYARASSAPPAVQNEKAAALWDGGAGRFHWSPCL